MITTANSTSDTKRFVLLDALRGVAALSVFIYHLQFNVMTPKVVSASVLSVMNYGCRGVQIFFVLSGFVITFSLRNTVLGSRSISQFAVKRQLRLDLPYWAAIALTVGLTLMHRLAHVRNPGTLPDARTLLLNAIYLQNLVSAPKIMSVSWTLCMEVQFYLFFVALLWICQNQNAVGTPKAVTLFAVAFTGLVSLLFPQTTGWMMPHWCFFALGALCCWALSDRRAAYFLLLLMGGMGISAHRDGGYGVGVLTAGGIWIAGRRGLLNTMTGGSVLQFLGTISYSLYLTHCLTFNFVLNLGAHFAHTSRVAIWCWVIASVPLTILAAQWFYTLIERPSMRWSSQFSRRFKTSHLSAASTQLLSPENCVGYKLADVI